MPRRIRRILVPLIGCLMALLCACALPTPVPEEDGGHAVDFSAAGQSASPEQQSPVQSGSNAFLAITDMAGRTVEFDAYPTRIAALDEGACEIVYAIGAGENVVARGAFCDYPQAVGSVTGVSMNENISATQLLPVEPDVIFVTPSALVQDQLDLLEDAGARIVVIEAHSIAETYASINLIGAVLGKSTEAGQLIASMVSGFAALQASMKGSSKTIYFETGTTETGLTTLGGDSVVTELCAFIGAHNEFEDLTGEPEITYDQVEGRNPDFIIQTYQTGSEEGKSAKDDLLARQDWDALKAVSAGRVVYLSRTLLTRPGPRLVDAAQALHDACYGELVPEESAAPEETPES